MTTSIGLITTLYRLEPRPPLLRPVVECDRSALAAFLESLSAQSTHQRFFTGGFRATPATLDALMGLNGKAGAFVAVEGTRIVGHAMWGAFPDEPGRVDVGFVIAEDRRRQGLASELTRRVIGDAVAHGASSIQASVLASNDGARALVRQLLPCARSVYDGNEVIFVSLLGVAGCGDSRAAA